MKNLTKLVNGTRKAVGLGLAGAILYGTVGCATMTPAQKTALLGESLSVLGSLNTKGSNTKAGRAVSDIMTTSGRVINNQALMKERLEIANAGRDQIVINNNEPEYSNQNQNYSQNQNYRSENSLTPEGFFMYTNWVDRNNDGISNGNEFLDLNEPVYDLHNLDFLKFGLCGGRNNSYEGQDLSLELYTMKHRGKLIDSVNGKFNLGSNVQEFIFTNECFPESGKYKAVLNTSNGRTFSLYFDIIK